jgi:hypothetical protein
MESIPGNSKGHYVVSDFLNQQHMHKKHTPCVPWEVSDLGDPPQKANSRLDSMRYVAVGGVHIDLTVAF